MKKKSVKNIFIAFILNLFFSIFELIGGIFTNSVSIISDSIHDFGDAISIFISLMLEKRANKKPDNNYTFGYLRYSTLGALLTSSILFIGSIIVLIGAVERIVNPVVVNYDGMFLLSIIGIIVNLIATKITSHSDNINEKTVSLHMLEDVLGWVCVFVGSIIMKFTDWYIIDPILSILVALFILINVFKKFKEIFDILLEKKPSNIDVEEIRSHLLKIKNINDIHHIHLWTIDGVNNYITLHVSVNSKVMCSDLDKIKELINSELVEHGINHSTIEFESSECKNRECKSNKCVNIHVHKH